MQLKQQSVIKSTMSVVATALPLCPALCLKNGAMDLPVKLWRQQVLRHRWIAAAAGAATKSKRVGIVTKAVAIVQEPMPAPPFRPLLVFRAVAVDVVLREMARQQFKEVKRNQ